jgi:hypothetical protein
MVGSSSSFKLKTSLIGSRTSHLDACTTMEHVHPSYVHMVLQIWLTHWIKFEPKFYAQILIVFSLWANPTKYHPYLLWTLKWFFNFLYWNDLISTIYYPFLLQSSSTIFRTHIHTSYYSKHWIAWIMPILALNNWISLGMPLHGLPLICTCQLV